MKKRVILSLLLLASLFSFGQDYNSVAQLINTNLQSNNKITAQKHREVEFALLDFIQANLFQSGDIKLVKVDLAYLNDNFEVNGLGKNLRLGWAICNGNNGTYNLNGRVVVGFGSGYALGQTGGSKDAVVVSHNHSVNLQQLNSNNDNGFGKLATGNAPVEGVIPNINTETTGVSGTDKNMQPYLVALYIMKL